MSKKFILLIILLGIIIGGVFWSQRQGDISGFISSGEEKWLTYQSKEGGFSIDYRISPDGYISVPQRTDSPSPIITLLYKETDYKELMESTEPREGPPGIAILVFPNVTEKSIQEWIGNHNESNYQLIIGKEEIKKIGTIEVVRYNIDGLYQSHTLAALNNNSAILIFGAYLEKGDSYEKDFKSFVQTLTFF